MKTIHNSIGILLLVLCTTWFTSCSKSEETDIIDPSYKTFTFSGGANLDIPVLTNNWTIEFVEDASSGQKILDKADVPLTLNKKSGKIEAANGWLELTREEDNRFTINLKENFDKSADRKLVVCINSAGDRNYITITQKAGSEYKVVKTAYTEIETERKVYTSDEGCERVTFTNNTRESVWERYDDIVFGNIVESSEFESNDYGAFDWMPQEGTKITPPELIIDGKIEGSRNLCLYKKGVITTPYIRGGSSQKILVEPNFTINMSGKVTYCKRSYNYTFTIQNAESGTQFEVKGVWRQIAAISSHSIIS